MATFVLIHGGCHGSWCYARVAALLRAAQHDVHTPNLSGVGESIHLATQAINLSTHVRDVVGVLQAFDLQDVILCGHSYGGMVITGAAGQVAERIKALVYLDGCVPDDNQSLMDIVGPERALRMLEAAGESGTMMAAPRAEMFQVNPDDRAWVDRLCTPHPIACFIQKLRLTGREAEVAARTYIRADRYHSINYPTYERVKDLPGWKVASVDCGHDMMIDEPEALAKLLLARGGSLATSAFMPIPF